MTVGLTPTPQLGTLGRKQEAHPHPDLQPSSVSLLTKKGGVASEKIPLALPQRKGWKPGVTRSREPGWNSLIKNSPCKGRAGLTNPTWLPFPQGPSGTLRTLLSPTAAFGPCPALVSLGPQPRVSCGQAGQDGQPEVSTL